MRLGIVYKITNLVNGKWYIGKDKNNDPNYLGSGVLLKSALKKYGKVNFKKEILIEVPIDQLDNAEIRFITETNAVEDKMSYNIAPGGTGGIASDKFIQSRHDGRKKWWASLTEEERFKYQSLRSKGWWNKLSTEEQKSLAEKKSINVKNFHAEMAEDAKHERVQNHRNKISRICKVTSPTGDIIITNRLREFSKEVNVSYNSLNISIKEKRPVKNGWICEVINGNS